MISRNDEGKIVNTHIQHVTHIQPIEDRGIIEKELAAAEQAVVDAQAYVEEIKTDLAIYDRLVLEDQAQSDANNGITQSDEIV